MIADVELGKNCTFIGFKGEDEEDIKNRIAKREGLSDYGKSLLVVNPRK